MPHMPDWYLERNYELINAFDDGNLLDRRLHDCASSV